MSGGCQFDEGVGRRQDRQVVDGGEHQQVLVATDQPAGVACLCRVNELVVVGIAALGGKVGRKRHPVGNGGKSCRSCCRISGDR